MRKLMDSKVATGVLARLAARVGPGALAFLLASSLAAQTYQVLHDFSPISLVGLRAGLIADASGNLYGTTSGGGSSGMGTVFKLDAANAYALTTLHDFNGADGADPEAAVVAEASGNLYGTTAAGGVFGHGTVFKLDATNDYNLTTLHDFAGDDGEIPVAAVVADTSGSLYGTTSGGGSSGMGTVFKLDAANAYALTTLHDFGGPDGKDPAAAVLVDASGNLYGTTVSGGSNDYGTVFKLDAANDYALTTLHNFGGPDGRYPYAAVVADAAGDLYGTTFGEHELGDEGTVFRLDAANAYALTTLHRFDGQDGAHPYAALLTDAAGDFFGTTYGESDGASFGTVFQLDAANNYALTTLHGFAWSDGAYPRAAVVADASGNLYGTTSEQFTETAFRLDASNGYALTTLHGFSGGPDGGAPDAAVIADAAGNLYGTTRTGGLTSGGTVFRLDAANSYALTTLHNFSGPDGRNPSAALIADTSGNLYGTTFSGGSYDRGTVFKLDAANGYALTTLHSFAGPDGRGPSAAVIADASGNLYGTTSYGGASSSGTVFRLEAANNYTLTTLHAFDGGLGGEYPYAAVTADAAGNLYGTTYLGGSLPGIGTVFKLDAGSNYALTTLHDFDGPDGANLIAGLLADASGNLYGTAATGGLGPGGGTAFKLDAANNYALATLHDFSGPDGSYPAGTVIADASGNLYGTTFFGGDFPDNGTVFKLDAANGYALTTLHSFDGPDGASAYAALIADASGNLFGTTREGGSGGTGVVFVLSTGVPAPVTGIAPTSGPSAGGSAMTIIGSGFSATASAWIGGIPAIGVTVVSATEITALTPALPPGRLNDVAVSNPTNGPSAPSVLVGAFFSDFLDVPQSDIFHADVETVFRNGITAGCGGGNYCRNNPVTRAQMAVFLLKAEHGSAYAPPACTGVFNDVECTPTRAFAVDWIEQLYDEAITGGCGGGNYCPGNSVTRAQMAVLLLKAEHGPNYAPPACSGLFPDVACTPTRAFAVDWIEQLSTEAITGGCGGGNYCPDNPVSRGQMAAFLTKTFGLP
jgi:uncharacterized repeat protein (TIGR03803 family)